MIDNCLFARDKQGWPDRSDITGSENSVVEAALTTEKQMQHDKEALASLLEPGVVELLVQGQTISRNHRAALHGPLSTAMATVLSLLFYSSLDHPGKRLPLLIKALCSPQNTCLRSSIACVCCYSHKF